MNSICTALVTLGTVFLSFAAPMAFAQDGSVRDDKNIVVMSHWTVKLPFALDENDPLTVGTVLDPMWGWITPGMQISTVNGIEIGNLNAVRAILRMSTKLTDQTQLTARFGTASGEEIAVLPIVQDTVLKNGMHFETVFDGQSWASTLVKRPQNATTDLQVGDRLVSYGNQVFDARESVQQIIQTERRKGMMTYEVAFIRGGNLTKGTITLAEDAPARDRSEIVVLSQWNVQMPMQADPDKPAIVSRTVGTKLVEIGDRIVSVNGIKVRTINAVSPVLRLSTEIDKQTGLEVDIKVKKAGSGQVEEQRMTLPIVQDTVLGNGMRFETKYAKHSWETHLVAMPQGVNTDLEIGDRILAYADGSPINARTSIKDIIENYRRKGMQDYEVVIMRDGDFMNCKLTY